MWKLRKNNYRMRFFSFFLIFPKLLLTTETKYDIIKSQKRKGIKNYEKFIQTF